MRLTRARLVVVLTLAVLLMHGASALANPTAVSLGGSFSGMVLDDADQHLIVSNFSGGIDVYNFDGGLAQTITSGVSTPTAMVIHGSTLYVANADDQTSGAGFIEAFNLTTFADEGPVATGLTNPSQLDFAGGQLWTTETLNGSGELVSVSLSGAVTSFPLAYQPDDLAASPSTPTYLYVVDGAPSGPIYKYDVSTGSPVEVASGTANAGPQGIGRIALSPDGTLVIAPTANGATELSASTLEPDGVIYPALSMGVGPVATSPANGGIVMTGTGRIFPIGSSLPFDWPSGYQGGTTATSVAMTADGSRAFSVAAPNGGSVLLIWTTDPQATATGLSMSPGSLTFGQPATLTATVVPSDGGGTVSFEASSYWAAENPIPGCGSVSLVTGSTGESATATCVTSSLPSGSSVQIAAAYTGDSAHSSSSSAVTTTTVGLPPGSDYTWIGADRNYAGNQIGNWSLSDNWLQGIGPSGSVGTLTFPDIGACEYGICYASNDASGLAANGLLVNSSNPYWLEGNSLSLGSGGLTVEGQASDGTRASVVGLPLVLTAPQSWRLDENDIPLYGVTGNQPLTLDFIAGSSAQPEADIEVGPITESGAGALYFNANTTVNSSDGNSIEIENGSGVEADQHSNSAGPLTVDSTGWVSVGGVADGASSLAVDGALTFKAGSEFDVGIDAPGTDASNDYSQLTASGNVNLGGATLEVDLGADARGRCDNLNPGDVVTLMSTTGTITGTFSNYAPGSSVDIVNKCDHSTQDARGTINYTSHAVTLAITNGGNAGGIGGAGATGSDPPVEVSPPSLSGNAQWGETLSVDPGTWEQETSLEYSWWACDADGNCEQITNADASSFQLTPAQVGDQVGAIVTAVGPGGTNYDYTNLSGVVAAEPVPVGTALPTVSGTTTVGSTLTAANGSWANSPTAYQYAWERCASYGAACNLISGATAPTYLLTTADAGSTLRVEVTASNFGGKSAVAVSSATGVIRSASAAATPATTTAAVTTALHGVLKPTGKTASLSAVLAHRGYTFSFTAPAAGTVTVSWTTTIKHRMIIVARGTASAAAAGATTVPVHLTSTGIAALRRYSRLRIKSKVTFTTLGVHPVSISSSFTLPGRHSAHRLQKDARALTVRRIRRASGDRPGVMGNPSHIRASAFRR